MVASAVHSPVPMRDALLLTSSVLHPLMLGAVLLTAGCPADDPATAEESSTSDGSGSSSSSPTTGASDSTSTSAQTSGSDSITGATSTTADTEGTGTDEGSSSSDTGSEGAEESSGSSGVELCPFFADEFDGAALDPAWAVEQPESIAVANGELELINTPEADDRTAVRLDQLDLNVAQLTLELGSIPPTESSQIRFNIFDPQNNRLFFVVQSDDLQIRRGAPDQTALNEFSTPMDPVAHAFLRFDIDAPTVEFQASPDGVTWTTLHTETIDWDYAQSSIAIATENFIALPEAETLSVRSFDLCLE